MTSPPRWIGRSEPPHIGQAAPSRNLLVTGSDGHIGTAEWIKGPAGWRINRCSPELGWMRDLTPDEIRARLEREGLRWGWSK